MPAMHFGHYIVISPDNFTFQEHCCQTAEYGQTFARQIYFADKHFAHQLTAKTVGIYIYIYIYTYKLTMYLKDLLQQSASSKKNRLPPEDSF